MTTNKEGLAGFASKMLNDVYDMGASTLDPETIKAGEKAMNKLLTKCGVTPSSSNYRVLREGVELAMQAESVETKNGRPGNVLVPLLFVLRKLEVDSASSEDTPQQKAPFSGKKSYLIEFDKDLDHATNLIYQAAFSNKNLVQSLEEQGLADRVDVHLDDLSKKSHLAGFCTDPKCDHTNK